jgi:hypothetical protein
MPRKQADKSTPRSSTAERHYAEKWLVLDRRSLNPLTSAEAQAARVSCGSRFVRGSCPAYRRREVYRSCHPLLDRTITITIRVVAAREYEIDA